MRGGYTYTCDRAVNQLTRLVRLLATEGVLQAEPDEGLIRQCVRRCDSCRNKKGANRCRGWQTVVDRGVLVLGPIHQAGAPPIRVELSADCSFARSAPARASGWMERPLSNSTVVVEVFDIESDSLVERHHVDLANRGQAGPSWHLQFGGNPAGEVADLSTTWLDEPRWPIAPLDLTLLVEVVTYNFFPDHWRRLNQDGEWLNLIWAAEDLVVSHFARFISAHFERDAAQRQETWLGAQDNAVFDPRPT